MVISPQDTSKALDGHPPGTFLVRLSNADPKSAPFTISVRNNKRIYRYDTGFGLSSNRDREEGGGGIPTSPPHPRERVRTALWQFEGLGGQ